MVLNRKPERDVAEAIEMTVMCQEFHTLPQAGGLYDQNSYDVWRMTLVLAAQAELREKEDAAAERRARR